MVVALVIKQGLRAGVAASRVSGELRTHLTAHVFTAHEFYGRKVA